MFKELKYKALKAVVNTVGQTSDGLRLCTEYGFTSGKMLDYIYENKPSGKFFIGKMIDAMFIRHLGWESIRTRKSNLIKGLKSAIEASLSDKKDVFIVDVASGPAKYILEVMNDYKCEKVSAVCRDIDERWLNEGKANAKELGLINIDFIGGNAFDENDFKTLKNQPNIVVSSGFYDWITDDELIKKSFQIIYDNLPKGGYFVFTNQSGHVNLELVSKVFEDFNHKPLEMTVRNAELINGWAKEIGFNIVQTEQDKYGYYSITLAQKQ